MGPSDSETIRLLQKEVKDWKRCSVLLNARNKWLKKQVIRYFLGELQSFVWCPYTHRGFEHLLYISLPPEVVISYTAMEVEVWRCSKSHESKKAALRCEAETKKAIAEWAEAVL